LGFSFASTYQKGVKGRYQLTVGDKAWAKLKQNLKEVTRKTAPKSFEERIRKINDPSLKGEQAKQIQRGWLNYFRGTSIQGKLRDIDGWLRNRLRYCIWTDWKNCSEAKITNTKKTIKTHELNPNVKGKT
jgi:hypothetical protein